MFSSAGVTATASGQISTSLIWGILIIGVSTGAYCIYGGLDSVVWTDVFQVIVLLTAGVLVTVVALDKAGGWDNVVAINNAANKARMHLVKPATDSLAPWTGIITLWLTLGIWYNCTNQFYIQQTSARNNACRDTINSINRIGCSHHVYCIKCVKQRIHHFYH